MSNLSDFAGAFGDFTTMALDTGLLKGAVIKMWYHPDGEPDGSEMPFYKVIVGYTMLPTDVLLHIVDVEEEPDDVDIDELIERAGIEFHLLSRFCGRHGFSILPRDQFNSEAE